MHAQPKADGVRKIRRISKRQTHFRYQSMFLRRSNRAAWLFLMPSLIGVLTFGVFPLIDTVRRSFFTMGGLFTGLENYGRVLANEAFRLAAWNTVRFVGISIPILLLLSFFIASALRLAAPIAKTAFMIPMAFPAASLAVLWQSTFHENGLLNSVVESIGLQQMPWMTSDLALYVLVVVYIWKNAGINIILFLAGLSNIPAEQYEAAKMDGANRIQQAAYITLPNLRNVTFITVVLLMIHSFRIFREAYLVAGSYPHPSMYVLQHTFNNWFAALEMDKLCSGATLMAAVMFLMITGISLLREEKSL